MMRWANDYIGIPFKDRGRDRAGIDCWGLVRLIYLERYQLELPSLAYPSSAEPKSVAEEFDALWGSQDWRSFFNQELYPQEGDIVILRSRGFPGHAGVMVDQNRFLHAIEGAGSSIGSLLDARWWLKQEGFYRAK